VLGQRLVLERNRDYFSGGPKSPPRIDKVEIRFIPDTTTQVAEVVAGRLDLIMNVARDQAEQLRGRPRLQIVASESAIITYLQLNTLPTTPAPPLLDARVRRAIAHAIDREAIVRAMQGPNGRILHTECHPVQFGCSDAGAPRYAYDPDQARGLLAEAGYADGLELDLHAYSHRNEVEAIANYLGAVGIRVRLRFLQTSAVSTAVAAGRTAIAHFRQHLGISADVSRTLPLNHTFFTADVNRDPEVRDLILHGNSVLDDAERRTAYASALALIAERAYVLPLYAVAQHFVANEELVFTAYPDTMPRFYEMYYR
jgi:peptide/nickel transport system substrate-binding protein